MVFRITDALVVAIIGAVCPLVFHATLPHNATKMGMVIFYFILHGGYEPAYRMYSASDPESP